MDTSPVKELGIPVSVFIRNVNNVYMYKLFHSMTEIQI